MWVKNPVRSGTPVYPLGTDRLGRDILSRYLYGVRTSFLLVLGAIPLAAIFRFSDWVDLRVLWRKSGCGDHLLMDITQSLPGIMFMLITILILRSKFEPSWISGIFTLTVGFSSVAWVSLARMVRVSVLQLRSQLFIEAAVAIGATKWRIITRHLLPNVSHVILIWVVNNVPAVILTGSHPRLYWRGSNQRVSRKRFFGNKLGWIILHTGRSTLSSNP